jgi:hypothetical protein
MGMLQGHDIRHFALPCATPSRFLRAIACPLPSSTLDSPQPASYARYNTAPLPSFSILLTPHDHPQLTLHFLSLPRIPLTSGSLVVGRALGAMYRVRPTYHCCNLSNLTDKKRPLLKTSNCRKRSRGVGGRLGVCASFAGFHIAEKGKDSMWHI